MLRHSVMYMRYGLILFLKLVEVPHDKRGILCKVQVSEYIHLKGLTLEILREFQKVLASKTHSRRSKKFVFLFHWQDANDVLCGLFAIYLLKLVFYLFFISSFLQSCIFNFRSAGNKTEALWTSRGKSIPTSSVSTWINSSITSRTHSSLGNCKSSAKQKHEKNKGQWICR